MQCHLSLCAAGVQRQGLPSLRDWAPRLQNSPPSHGAPLRQQFARQEELLPRRVAQLSCGAGSPQQDAQSHPHDAHSHQHSAHCGHTHGDEPVHLNASASEEEGAVVPAVMSLYYSPRLLHASPDHSVCLQCGSKWTGRPHCWGRLWRT